jgi:hypothetical protein
MVGPSTRGCRRFTPPKQLVAVRKQIVQPPVAPSSQTHLELRHSGATTIVIAPHMNRQNVAPITPRDGRGIVHRPPSRQLVSSEPTGRARYAPEASLARHCIPHSIPAWIYLEHGAVNATLTTFASEHGTRYADKHFHQTLAYAKV